MIDMDTTYSTKLTNQELLRAAAKRAENAAKVQKICDFIKKNLDRCFNEDGDVTSGAVIEITPHGVTFKQSFVDKYDIYSFH